MNDFRSTACATGAAWQQLFFIASLSLAGLAWPGAGLAADDQVAPADATQFVQMVVVKIDDRQAKLEGMDPLPLLPQAQIVNAIPGAAYKPARAVLPAQALIVLDAKQRIVSIRLVAAAPKDGVYTE